VYGIIRIGSLTYKVVNCFQRRDRNGTYFSKSNTADCCHINNNVSEIPQKPAVPELLQQPKMVIIFAKTLGRLKVFKVLFYLIHMSIQVNIHMILDHKAVIVLDISRVSQTLVPAFT